MTLRRLYLRNFCNHVETELDIPSRGVCLFLGSNGSGKSAVVEALLWALYGRALRASRDWSPVQDGSSVEAEFSDFLISREAKRRGSSARVEPVDAFGTANVNALMTKRFGQFRALVSSRVFHRATLARFSLAGDSDRKAVIEEILGVDAFDIALSGVIAEQQDIGKAIRRLDSDVRSSEGDLRVVLRMLRHYEDSPCADIDITALLDAQGDLEDLGECPDEPKHIVADRRARDKLYSLQGRLRAAEEQQQRVAKLVRAGKCPTCGQRITDSCAEKLAPEDNVALLRRTIEVQRKAVDDEIARNNATFAEYESGVDLVRKWEKKKQYLEIFIANERGAIRKLEEEIKRRDVELARLRAEAREIGEELSERQRKLASAQRRDLRLKDLRRIYGPRGARVVLLQDALKSISGDATDVLIGIRGGGEVAVRADAKMQSISVYADVGHGLTSYGGLSQGEGGVVDFALLRALSSVASVTPQAREFPFVYDDVLDALDDDVRMGVAEYITSEAQSAPVFVLSHDKRALDLFPDARVFPVICGKIQKKALLS